MHCSYCGLRFFGLRQHHSQSTPYPSPPLPPTDLARVLLGVPQGCLWPISCMAACCREHLHLLPLYPSDSQISCSTHSLWFSNCREHTAFDRKESISLRNKRGCQNRLLVDEDGEWTPSSLQGFERKEKEKHFLFSLDKMFLSIWAILAELARLDSWLPEKTVLWRIADWKKRIYPQGSGLCASTEHVIWRSTCKFLFYSCPISLGHLLHSSYWIWALHWNMTEEHTNKYTFQWVILQETQLFMSPFSN